MQDITEQQDIAQEISEAFSQRVQFADGFDEDELLAELEELEQEELNKKMTHMELPNAPSSSFPAQPSRKSTKPSTAHRSRAACVRIQPQEGRFSPRLSPVFSAVECHRVLLRTVATRRHSKPAAIKWTWRIIQTKKFSHCKAFQRVFDLTCVQQELFPENYNGGGVEGSHKIDVIGAKLESSSIAE
ncbi:hypothetical protein A6R68_09543, partial [Neotoma lepida]